MTSTNPLINIATHILRENGCDGEATLKFLVKTRGEKHDVATEAIQYALDNTFCSVVEPVVTKGDEAEVISASQDTASVAVAAHQVVEETIDILGGPEEPSVATAVAVEESPVEPPLTVLQPDERGEFQTPADGAKWMALTYRIPQIPLRGKAPFMESWPDKATLDLDQIDRWSQEFPGCNFGGVSKAVLGGRFVLEVDSPNVAKRAAKDGVTFTSELIIESRPGRGHRWYEQSDESISLGNMKQDASTDGDFSVRVHNEQCVSPGSVNPVSGKQYRVRLAESLGAASTAEINWLNGQRTDKYGKVTASIKIAKTDPEVKVPRGQIHPWMLTQSGRLRNNGLTPDEIEPILLRLVLLHCQGPIDESKVRAMAKSMSAYKEGNPAAEYVYTETGADVVETPTANVVEESLPDFPMLTGLLADLSEAVCPDIPREFKLMAAVTIWGLMRSGLDTLRNEHCQPRFYTFFVKEPGWGKTAAINEMRKYMSMLEAVSTISIVPSLDSGPALVDELKELSDKALFRHGTPEHPDPAKCLLAPDELTDLFEKAKQTAQSKNTLSSELLKLYEGNETGNRARGNNKGKKTHVRNAHLALIGGATPFGYESMWTSTGGGATGLQSRAVVITSVAPKMSIKKTPTDVGRAVEILGRLGKAANQGVREFVLTPRAEEMLHSWWQSKPRALDLHDSRAEDMVKRLLIVLAGCRDGLDDICGPDMTDYDLTIDCDLVALACQFGDYVIACREKFNVADSHSWVQSSELAIMKVARKHTQPLSQKDLRLLTNADRRPGGLSPFTQAMRNLTGEGMLIIVAKNRVGNPLYRPENS